MDSSGRYVWMPSRPPTILLAAACVLDHYYIVSVALFVGFVMGTLFGASIAFNVWLREDLTMDMPSRQDDSSGSKDTEPAYERHHGGWMMRLSIQLRCFVLAWISFTLSGLSATSASVIAWVTWIPVTMRRGLQSTSRPPRTRPAVEPSNLDLVGEFFARLAIQVGLPELKRLPPKIFPWGLTIDPSLLKVCCDDIFTAITFLGRDTNSEHDSTDRNLGIRVEVGGVSLEQSIMSKLGYATGKARDAMISATILVKHRMVDGVREPFVHVDALTFTMGHTSLNWAGVDVSRVAGWCGLSVAGIIEQHIARSLTRKCAPVLNNKIQELLNGLLKDPLQRVLDKAGVPLTPLRPAPARPPSIACGASARHGRQHE